MHSKSKQVYRVGLPKGSVPAGWIWQIDVIAATEHEALLIAIDKLRQCGQETMRWSMAKIKLVGKAEPKRIVKIYRKEA